MKYRSRTEIIALILGAANNGVTKTRMMYSAYLSHAQITEYVAFLTERQLLNFDEDTATYKLTEKGLHFLRACEELNKMIEVDNPRGAKKESLLTE